MISLDWKERLKKDTEDFFYRKLPEKDYDLGIIYNAYPERIDNKVPREIITFVAKALSSKLSKKPEQYLEFYDYMWNEKGEDGRHIFCYVIAKSIKKQPDIFANYIETILRRCDDEHFGAMVLDKAILPLLKKYPERYTQKVIQWLKNDNEIFALGTIHMLIKLVKSSPELINQISKKIESMWFNASDIITKVSIKYLKSISKIDRDQYLNIYKRYRNSREPIFAEILCGAINLYDPIIEEMVENWSKSGNVKLKRAGLSGKKLLKRKKKNA